MRSCICILGLLLSLIVEAAAQDLPASINKEYDSFEETTTYTLKKSFPEERTSIDGNTKVYLAIMPAIVEHQGSLRIAIAFLFTTLDGHELSQVTTMKVKMEKEIVNVSLSEISNTDAIVQKTLSHGTWSYIFQTQSEKSEQMFKLIEGIRGKLQLDSRQTWMEILI